MSDWFSTFDESLWLKPDDTGEDEAQFLMKALHLQPGMRVLDIPCGAGRVAVHLAKAGCRMTGMDRNPNFIARAQQRFEKENLDGEFLTLDMRDLDEVDSFDAILNWSGSFGYCTDEENINVLQRMTTALKPGGHLLIDQPNREWLLRHFQPATVTPKCTMHTRWDAHTQRLETTYFMQGDGQEQESTLSMRLYTPAQFRRLFAQVGLNWETAFGGKDGSPYSRISRRLIVIGKKVI